MTKPAAAADDFYNKACIFEASLILLAMLLGWLADINPFAALHFSEQDLLFAIVATIPVCLLFLLVEIIKIPSVLRIRELLLETLGATLHSYHWTDLFILAAIAGFSEELLFRGLVQPWLERSWGMGAGLLISNMLFGLVHAVTPLYAVLAMLVGLYLGLSMDYSGDRNLFIPVLIHGLYDFLAFLALMKVYRMAR